jgi:hypothetical protein
MGERNRIGSGSRGRRATLAACAGFAATMWACSDDSGVAPGVDAGPDGAVADSSTIDSGAADATTKDSGGNEATTIDTGSDASREASAEAGAVDSGKDATPSDATSMDAMMGSDAAVNDAAKTDGSDAAADAPVGDSTTDTGSRDGSMADANDAAPLAPLQWCPMLDSWWGLNDGGAMCATQTTQSCPDRAGTWAGNIEMDFLVALTSDCRLAEMADTRQMTNDQVAAYTNQVLAWTMTFFGCPLDMNDAGPSKFGLIPEARWGTHIFTTADLQALSDLYLNAGIGGALSDMGLPALTADQTTQITAQLTSYAAQVPNTQTAPTFTFDTCPADAGSDAADAATGDGAADAGGG